MNKTCFSTKKVARRSSAGFTLVETVIAMGIVAFAMLGILGLVPVGLTNFREAMNNTAESQIIQGVSNDILLTDYAKLTSTYAMGTTNISYYSDEGRLVSGGLSDTTSVFEVKIALSALTAPNLDQSSGQTVRVEVRRLNSNLPARKYSFIVPKG